MVRIAFALVLCGMTFAAAPARAQGEAADGAPSNGVPAEALPSPQTAPQPPAVESKPAETPAAESKPQEPPVAESKPPQPPAAAESKPAESPAAESPAAESKPPESGETRFTFSRAQDGYVRLDNRTGQVSFCSKRAVGWTCQLAPEDRGVLENEIARLQEENAALKKDMLRRGLPLPGGSKPDASVSRNERPSFSLPSDPNLDRMKDFVGEVWRRLVALIVNLQKDVLKKS